MARINLAKHHIGDQGAQAFSALELGSLSLAFSQRQALAQALDTNSAVTHINLRSSGLRSEGAQAVEANPSTASVRLPP